MDYRIAFSTDATRDLDDLFDFLADSYQTFGEGLETSLRRADARVKQIRNTAKSSLRAAPHRGTLHDDLLKGLRHTTIDRAVYWFQVDERAEVVRVLAVFYGGQDHHRRMLARLFRALPPEDGTPER